MNLIIYDTLILIVELDAIELPAEALFALKTFPLFCNQVCDTY